MKLNIVPARTGFTWVKLGIRTYLKQPLALSGLFFMYMAAGSLLSFIPVLGVPLALMIIPAATLGLMVATQEAEKGKFPMPTVLISAFRASREQARSILILGALYAAICMLVLLGLVPLLASAPTAAANPTTTEAAQAMMTPQFMRYVLVTGLLYTPISLLFWHAPALVHWHGVSPVKSLFFSFVACIRNSGALLAFGLGWLVVFFAMTMLLAAVGAITGSPSLVAAATLPMALLMSAMFSTSLYFTFRDSFIVTEAADAATEPRL